jgi:RNA polymerase sigma factor (sigma-70 family)
VYHGPEMDDPAADGELVARARGGDLAAFGALVERHRRVALRVAATLAGGDADAEDAVQDAFVKAHRALDRFRPDAPFRPWLLSIVANEARNRRRSAGRRAQLALRAGGSDGEGLGSSAEDEVVAAERRRALAAAIDRLAERDRDVIACRWLAELSEAETAAVLGCRPGTVKSRLSRAMERLRASLPAEEVLR